MINRDWCVLPCHIHACHDTWYICVCVLWQSPDTWCYDRLIPSLPKLCIVYYCNTCDNWLMLYAMMSFNSRFIHDISHSTYFILSLSHYVHMYTIPLFLHTHWKFWLSGFAHSAIWVFLLLSRYLKRSCLFEEYGVSFAWSLGSFGTFDIFFFILLTSFDSLLFGLHIVLFDLLVE